MNKYLVKLAKGSSKSDEDNLRPHTVRALRKIDTQDGLLIDHSMGSGKTLLYLKAIEKYQKKNPQDKALIIAPASLTTNIQKEIHKHHVQIDPNRLTTLSYEKATNDSDKLRAENYGMVVADESHKLRSTGTKRYKELSEVILHARKRLLGTGTAAYNHPSDIAPLVNLAAGKKVLPEGKKEFEMEYVNKVLEQPPFLKRIMGHPPREVQKLMNEKKLGKILRENVDHYDLKDDPEAKDKFPEKVETVKEVEMSPEQHTLYKYLEGRLPWHLRLKVRMNIPLDKKDVQHLQAFATGIRQVSNSTRSIMPKYDKSTPKVVAAVDSVEKGLKTDKNFRGLVYSNYLGSGLDDYSRELSHRGIKHVVYHGGLSKQKKDEMLEAYNSGKVPVMLLSSSGAEGLNTKGTKKVQILEPHFNKSKIDQVIARGVRYESHAHLPAKERKVEVEHYHSVFPKSKWHFGPQQHSIDQYLYHNAKTKSELGDQMKELVKEAGQRNSFMVKCEDLLTRQCIMVKSAAASLTLGEHDYSRAKYKESPDWSSVPNPAGSVKWDGAAFFLEFDKTGKPRFLSRRPSVQGGYPDRTANLMHVPDIHLPQFAGNAYHVELIHTGKDFHDEILDSHPIVSGILNSKPERALATQKEIGPVRIMLLDVIKPKINTFEEKLQHLEELKKAFGEAPNVHMPAIKIGTEAIGKLLTDTKARGHEGVIVTSLTQPEDKNVRFKVKHVDTYNLRVVRVIQEIDIHGNPKESMGALEVMDGSGKIVAKVGTGFTRALRQEIWQHPEEWVGKLIQVKAMPTTSKRLRAPVYNGLGDGDIDTVNERFTQ